MTVNDCLKACVMTQFTDNQEKAIMWEAYIRATAYHRVVDRRHTVDTFQHKFVDKIWREIYHRPALLKKIEQKYNECESLPASQAKKFEDDYIKEKEAMYLYVYGRTVRKKR